jgi:hypothetical protein
MRGLGSKDPEVTAQFRAGLEYREYCNAGREPAAARGPRATT